MKNLVPARSIHTVVMAIGVATLLALVVMVALSWVRPLTVGYVALLVTGVGMLMRDRVFASPTR
jgi:hypothetical protein